MPSSKIEYTLNLRQATYALSEAFDYVGVDDILHGKRVAYIAAQLGKALGLSQELIDDLIYCGMLHDCGVSSTDVHSFLVSELDWDNSAVHCLKGSKLVQQVSFYQPYALTILHHHTHWDMFEEAIDEHEKLKANIIYLADRIDALRSQNKILGMNTTDTIQQTIKKYSGIMFSPELVKAFLKISQNDSFWFYLEPEPLEIYFTAWIKKGILSPLSFQELKEISLMFAASVDAKSEFTYAHSLGVSKLARYLAVLLNLELSQCETIEIAGLLHDLGKLRVEDAILDKPAKLDEHERIKMNRHSFDSAVILNKIDGFQEIASIASLHHETMDATGYPYGMSASELPFEARILCVADIFQALVQTRPYRKGLSANETLLILKDLEKNNKLDPLVIECVEHHLHACYKKAL